MHKPTSFGAFERDHIWIEAPVQRYIRQLPPRAIHRMLRLALPGARSYA